MTAPCACLTSSPWSSAQVSITIMVKLCSLLVLIVRSFQVLRPSPFHLSAHIRRAYSTAPKYSRHVLWFCVNEGGGGGGGMKHYHRVSAWKHVNESTLKGCSLAPKLRHRFQTGWCEQKSRIKLEPTSRANPSLTLSVAVFPQDKFESPRTHNAHDPSIHIKIDKKKHPLSRFGIKYVRMMI